MDFYVFVGGGTGAVKSPKTRVGFGRTEVCVRLDGIVFCALSFGHGPRGQGSGGVSKGVDFHVLLGAVLVGQK